MSIILREATKADLALLKRWDSYEHTPPDPEEGWNWEEELGAPSPGRRQIIAELDGRPLGFIQLLDLSLDVSGYWGHLERPAGHASIDIWIGEVEDLNKGYGRELMRQAIADLFADPAIHTIVGYFASMGSIPTGFAFAKLKPDRLSLGKLSGNTKNPYNQLHNVNAAAA